MTGVEGTEEVPVAQESTLVAGDPVAPEVILENEGAPLPDEAAPKTIPEQSPAEG